MPSYTAYCNGKFISEESIVISPNDRGFLYGDGVFDSLRAVQKKIVSYRAHFDRLTGNCRRADIRLPFSEKDLRHLLGDLLIKNDLSDAYLRITITRGIGDQFGYGYAKEIKPTVLMVARPFKSVPEQIYEKGVSIEFEQSSLFNSHDRLTKIKSLSAQAYVLAKQNALKQNCYETVFVDAFDNIYEGTSSNIFFIKNETLVTPFLDAGILPGTTRERVKDIAKEKLRMTVVERQVTKSELLDADEIFLTNTNIQVLPVIRASGVAIGAGRPGLTTRRILDTFRQTLIEILE
jgi:branched-chain amino acid aminotransferase